MNDSKLATFYLLDLDRTLLDTVKSSEIMRQAVAEYDPEIAVELSKKIEDYSLMGESFSMYDFILEKVGTVNIAGVITAYTRLMADQAVLNPGARELIAYIRRQPDVGIGILTFGSVPGQTLKIEASGLGDIPFLVTHETFKGELIRSWRFGPGEYKLPVEYGSVAAQSIVLVDDKPFSFQGLPADSRGYWVKSIYNAGEEHLASGIVPVATLKEVVTAEQQRNSIDKA